MIKPRLGIVANNNYFPDDLMPSALRSYVSQEYIMSFEQAGAIPLTVPVLQNLDNVAGQIQGLDGIVLSGGFDVDPLLYHEEPTQALGVVMRTVDDFYLKVIDQAIKQNIPIFGICKGLQMLNVYFGGTLYQDIKSQRKESLAHTQTNLRHLPSHRIECSPDTFCWSVFGKDALVNSHHHQAIKDLAPGLVACAHASDGIVEAVSSKDPDLRVFGVQWHPEMMCCTGDEGSKKLLTQFVDICR